MCKSKYFSQINIFIVIVFISISGFQINKAVAATLVVTNVNDSGVGSLRDLVNSAALGDTIKFDFSTNGIPIVLLSQIDLTDSLYIYGNGISNTILDGGGTNRIFNIPSGCFANVRNLKITNGHGFTLHGGGVYNQGKFYCDSCLFENNISEFFGGGIYSVNECHINNCTFKNNVALNNGGGAFFSPGGTLIIQYSTFIENHANLVGGAVVGGDSAVIFNSTFSGNSSGTKGGALYNFRRMYLQNSTIAFNSSDGVGGGILNAGNLNMTNTIISNNSSLGLGQDGYSGAGTIDTGCRNNIIGDTLSFGFIVGNNNLLEVDPTLDILNYNGGPTMTHALLCGSPAINSGIVTSYNTFDQRGQLRIYPDIGAFEFKDIDTSITVNKGVISAVQIGVSYEWLNCNTNAIIIGQNGPSYTATTNGSYAMIITNNGCTDTSRCANITTVGLDKNNIFDGIEFYPNPVRSKLAIHSTSFQMESVSILNLIGHVLFNKMKTGTNDFNFDTSELPSGIYIAEIELESLIARLKFVKQ